MDPYVYGNGGVLPSASSWYQSNASGLNPQMLTGMNNQWSQLGASAPGYQHMQNLGLSLMGGGVAGNPFTGGNMASGGGASAGPYQVPQMSPGPFTMPAQMPAASMRPGHEAPENGAHHVAAAVGHVASMRPGHEAPEN